jgi:hypothetical protein
LAAIHSPDEYKSGIAWPEPPILDPGDSSRAPSDAVVLFDGRNMDAFEGGENWLVENGYAIVRQGGITSKQAFGDCQLHLEFATPAEVSGEGQGRGNSGVYFMGKYELQILDSYENRTYYDGQCAAFYKQHPPAVNASRGPGQWQTYDVIFEAPRFDNDGRLVRPAYATVLHNGVLVHNHVELLGGTYFDRPPVYERHADKLPLHIQDHGNPLRFRNIWVRENIQPLKGTPPAAAPQAMPPAAETGNYVPEPATSPGAADPCANSRVDPCCCPRPCRPAASWRNPRCPQ